ncbi:MAG TPA: DUF192 domain-containing protein [Solirubrobacterales bacterium]
MAIAPRLRRLPTTLALGFEVAVAVGPRARLLGLAQLDRDAAGTGLLIPRCASVHTFGMRFALDLYFLGADGEPVEIRREIGARRVISSRGARAVLEIPSRQGGEFSSRRP